MRAADVDVRVEGVEDELRDNVLSVLTIAHLAEADEDPAESAIRQAHERAAEEIDTALQPFGYYRSRVQSELTRDGDDWNARYVIDAGPPLPVAGVEIELTGGGASEPGLERLAEEFPLRPGEQLDHREYQAGKESFAEYASENGYLDAAFQVSQIRVDRTSYDSRIVLHFDTGPRYRYGSVTFQQDVLDPSLLRGYVKFEPGEPFDVDEVLAFQNALSESPYFRQVEVIPEREDAVDDRVPIRVRLVPAPRQRWRAGIGYGTDTGPRGSVTAELRRINRRGHRGESELVVSDLEQSIAATYIVPGAYPRTDLLSYSVGYADVRQEGRESRTALVGGNWSRDIGKWRHTFGLTWRRESFEVGVDDGVVALLTPEAGWTQVSADDRLRPMHGRSLEFRVRGAHESVLSDASFFQLVGRAKYARALGGTFRALGRLEVGRIFTDEFRRLPANARFFAGGDQSVRGYGYRDIGPVDEEGNVIGGEALLTASLEVESMFFEKWGLWGLAAFFDAGAAMESLSGDLKRGTGLGIRWLSPVGMVRADAAVALDEPGRPVRFHLTIGPDL